MRLNLSAMNDSIFKNWEKKSADRQKQYKQYLQRANKKKVLKALPDLHEEAFEQVDCLQCGNCCKGYSPRFKTPDIKRLARFLKIREGDVIENWLRVDEDGDFVMRSTPCAFLGADNYCSVYEARPGDCQRFPYTDEDVILRRQQITLKNSSFCPAVYYVLERLMQIG